MKCSHIRDGRFLSVPRFPVPVPFPGSQNFSVLVPGSHNFRFRSGSNAGTPWFPGCPAGTDIRKTTSAGAAFYNEFSPAGVARSRPLLFPVSVFPAPARMRAAAGAESNDAFPSIPRITVATAPRLGSELYRKGCSPQCQGTVKSVVTAGPARPRWLWCQRTSSPRMSPASRQVFIRAKKASDPGP